MDADALLLRVRRGELEGAGSWIYAWLRCEGDRKVVYVGSTGLHPATRAWLHLNDPDPAIGRVAARLPGVATEPLDVLALRLPPHVSRQDAKAALIERLAELDLLSPDYAGDSPLPVGEVAAECVVQVDLLADRVEAHRAGS